MRIRNLLFLPVMIAALVLTGALAQGTSAPQSPATSTGNTGSQQPNDILQGRILQDLRSQNLNNVSVKVKDNKVVLSGSVPDDASHANAVQIAKSLASDRKLVDHITIGNNANNQTSAPMSEQPPGRYGNGTNNPSQPMPPTTPRH